MDAVSAAPYQRGSLLMNLLIQWDTIDFAIFLGCEVCLFFLFWEKIIWMWLTLFKAHCFYVFVEFIGFFKMFYLELSILIILANRSDLFRKTYDWLSTISITLSLFLDFWKLRNQLNLKIIHLIERIWEVNCSHHLFFHRWTFCLLVFLSN